jgi:hypothetical protein
VKRRGREPPNGPRRRPRGDPLVVGERDRKRVLTMRDMQHEYVLTEAK